MSSTPSNSFYVTSRPEDDPASYHPNYLSAVKMIFPYFDELSLRAQYEAMAKINETREVVETDIPWSFWVC